MDLPSTSKSVNQISIDVPLVKKVRKIEFTPNIPNPHYLKQCYLALYEHNELIVPPEVFKAILKTTCHIQFDILDETLQNVLLDMLQYLLLVWPLWPSVHNAIDSVEVHQLYSTFLSYIRQHLSDVVLNEKMYRGQFKEKVDKSTDTSDLIKVKEEAPFGIVIGGPAFIQNSTMFAVNTASDDVVLLSYGCKSFPKLHLNQLLNWPYVSVYVSFMDVVFVRRNVHEFKRYLCSAGLTASNTTNNDPTVPVLYRRSDAAQNSKYSVVRFEYLKLYLCELWKSIDVFVNGKLSSILGKIFDQFLLDIQEIGVQGNVVTVGTSVRFNIGGQKYHRNRTVLRENELNVNKKAFLDEEIIPKVEYTLLKFSADRILRGFLKLDKKLVNTSDFIITFTCQFCKQIYGGLNACDMMQQHMEKEHVQELSVYCFKCNRNYEVADLAANRWKHLCMNNP